MSASHGKQRCLTYLKLAIFANTYVDNPKTHIPELTGVVRTIDD
jgi:hypothetical protein